MRFNEISLTIELRRMVTELITTRAPTISDLEDIVHLNRVSLPENYAIAHFIELIKNWHETSCVAEIDGKVVGYIITRVEKGSLSPWRPRGKSRAHVISVAVSPDQRRKGIGEKMMIFTHQRVLDVGNIDKITLEVRISNTPAIRMYKKLNYVAAKVLKHYYSDGEDAYLMELTIE